MSSFLNISAHPWNKSTLENEDSSPLKIWGYTLLLKSLILMRYWRWWVNIFYTFVSMKGQKVKMRSQWKVSTYKLCTEQGTHKQVLASTLNSLIVTTNWLHLTLFQPLVIEHYNANQYPHSTIVYRQQQQPISFLSSTSYGTTIKQ